MKTADDPRFTRLPQRFVDEIATHEPTGIKDGTTWHEVQFDMGGGVMCQCAVVDGAYVLLSSDEVAGFQRILKIFPKHEDSPA